MSSSWNTEVSPFASVIGTNYVPSIAELKSLKALLVPPQHELSRVVNEIDRVQTLLAHLFAYRHRIESYIEAHRALASPIRHIPSETLAEIFMQCLPTSALRSSYPVRDLNVAPLLLTKICRHWRNVALNTPQLWNSLHIFLPSQLTPSACSQRIAGMKLWLRRSGALPLSLSFHGSILVEGLMTDRKDLAAISQENMERMISESLMPFSDRFRDIDLSLTLPIFATFNKLSPSTFPTLESLRVNAAGPIGNGQGSQSFGPLLSRMPCLKVLEVNRFLVNDKDYHSLPVYNWGNLTNLTIDDPLTIVEIVATLSQTPLMQSVFFHIFIGPIDSTTARTTLPVAPIHLDNLTEMRLVCIPGPVTALHAAHPEYIAHFFQNKMSLFTECIQCPALRKFGCSTDWPVLVVPKWPFTGLPMHGLETLDLDIPLMPDALTECLLQTPNLVNFQFKTHWHKLFPLQDSHLYGLVLSPVSLAISTPSSSSPSTLGPWWSHLQNIRILSHVSIYPVPRFYSGSESMIPFTSAALTNLLQSRSQTQTVSRLKSCEVLYHASADISFSEAELNTLQHLKHGGMKLRMHYQRAKSPPPRSNLPQSVVYNDSPYIGMHEAYSDTQSLL